MKKIHVNMREWYIKIILGFPPECKKDVTGKQPEKTVAIPTEI